MISKLLNAKPRRQFKKKMAENKFQIPRRCNENNAFYTYRIWDLDNLVQAF